MLRYTYYREHKYVLFAITELERLIAKTDFRVDKAVSQIRRELDSVHHMLKFHARHEDKFHELLRKKNSEIHHEIERDHENHDAIFSELQQQLNAILINKDDDDRILKGRLFYLSYREFEVENLRHINQEERVLMPELQRLYNDAELMKIEADIYEIMTAEQMQGMIEALFPHMNPDDHASFLNDIKRSQPEKYSNLKTLDQVMSE